MFDKFDDVLKISGLNDDEAFAAGVSGGADSLALVYQLKKWADKCGKKIIALTVDHGLRPTSRKEAEYVAELMAKLGVEHHILVWDGEKPSGGIETIAREKRYALLEEWCVKNHIQGIFVAHHERDQAETFLMRLQRGSGVDGLCGMSPAFRRGKIIVLRPLLSTSPESLRDYLREREISWIEDESNECDDFLRVRVRKLLPLLDENLGLSAERIVSTMEILARTRRYMEEKTAAFIKHNVKSWDGAGYSLSVKIFAALHEEMQYRVLNELLKDTGSKIYPPRSDDVCRLAEKLKAAKFAGATLSGCEIFESRGKIWVVPELKIKAKPDKKQWADFIEKYPYYKKVVLPYKLRLSLMASHPI